MTTSMPSHTSLPLAVVLGASRGLGLLIARELGRRGHEVVIASRDAATLRRATGWLTEQGVPARWLVCDVTDDAAVRQLVEEVEGAGQPIEVMVCVAGIIQVGPLAALHRSDFEAAINSMLWGPINTSLAVVERMRQRGHGRIGIISSVGGLVAVPHLLPYATAKFGAVGFGRGLRAELAGTGVTVSTIAPGLMRTGSHLRAEFLGDQAREYAWFAAGASMPGVSMDAERAARRIVSAVLNGRAMLVLTPLATVGMWLNGLVPNLTAAVLSVLGRLLPSSVAEPSGPRVIEGWEAERRASPGSRTVLRALTFLGGRAADRFNERPSGQAPGPKG